MVSLSEVLIYLLIGLVTGYYLVIKYKYRKYPPGPFPYPLIGNLFETLAADARQPFFAFAKLAEKYGPVYSLKLGVVPIVVVNGYKALKDLSTSGVINNRQKEEWMLDRCFGSTDNGLIFSGDAAWRDNRRFTHKTLRDFGFGKQASMDELLFTEFRDLMDDLKRTIRDNNGLLRIENTFNAAFVNIIYTYLTGSRFTQDDPKLRELVALSNDFFSSQNFGGGVLGSFPFMKDWAPEWSGFSRTHRGNALMNDYFQNLITCHRQKGEYKAMPTNFTDAFLQRIDAGAKSDEFEAPIFTDKNLISLLSDLFAAGAETSANSTCCAVRRFIKEPEVQAKVQAELARVVGERDVTLADKPNLPFTEATMLEILRADSVGPITPRRAISTCSYAGFLIPKDTVVIANLYSGNMDKTIWGDPEVFRPERFLDNSNGKIINMDKLSSFGFGKRDCIGQVVAKSTLFMAIATLAQHFTFVMDPVTGMPGDEYTTGITIAPLPFMARVQIRRK